MPSMFDPEFHAKKKNITVEQARDIIASWRPTNIQYWIKKTNGDQALAQQLWHDHQKKGMKTRVQDRDKMRSENPRSKQYWMIRHNMTEEQATITVSDAQSINTLNKYQERYGEILGEEKFKERQQNWQKTLKSKPQNEIDRINKSKAVDHLTLVESLGVDGYLEFLKRQTCRPVYELQDHDQSIPCKIIKILESRYRLIIDSGEIPQDLLNDTIKLLTDNSVITRYEICIPYYPILRLKKIDILTQIKNNIYQEAHFKKAGRGYKVAYKGMIFDSKLEFSLYNHLHSKGIEVVRTRSSLKYPEGNYYFDFYLPILNTYVECTGMTKLSWYQKKIEKKKAIVESHNINCWFVSTLEELQSKLCL